MKNLLFVVCLFMVGFLNAQSKKEQIEILNNRVDSLNQVVSSQSKTINDKNSQINGLNSKITSLESNISVLNDNVSKLSSELQTFKTESKTKQQELITKNAEISDLQLQIKIKTDSLILLRSELEKLKPAAKPVVTSNNSGKVTQTGSYKSVKIGTQTWMSVNLNVSTFRNGDPIPQAKTDEEWKKAGDNEQPAWCYYDNDPANGAKYGKLYNWYAVIDPRGLAPEGWHVPSDAEWTKLTDFLGGDDEGTKMKNTDGWAENGNGTNTSGFSGLPGGLRFNNGAFDYIGGLGYWWSSTEGKTGSAWSRYLDYGYGDVKGGSSGGKRGGFSVRCLRD